MGGNGKEILVFSSLNPWISWFRSCYGQAALVAETGVDCILTSPAICRKIFLNCFCSSLSSWAFVEERWKETSRDTSWAQWRIEKAWMVPLHLCEAIILVNLEAFGGMGCPPTPLPMFLLILFLKTAKYLILFIHTIAIFSIWRSLNNYFHLVIF